MRKFRELEIWKKAIILAKDIYLITGVFPAKEKFGLSIQLQRAAVSVASNIAEGAARKSEIDFARFLEMSLGSAFELETQLLIARNIGYIKDVDLDKQLTEIHILQKQIHQLISIIRKKRANSQ